jgi:predicted enzyme related to lactoylglutathione lyase
MEYYEFKLNDRSVAGMMPIGADFPAEMPNNWLTYFAVADCDATVTEVQAAGGNVVNPAMDISVGRFAMVSDLAGAPFAVIQLAQ